MFLLVIAVLLAVAVWHPPLVKQIKQNERMHEELLRLEGKIIKEKETAVRLKEKIDALRNDPVTVERYATEKNALEYGIEQNEYKMFLDSVKRDIERLYKDIPNDELTLIKIK